MVGGAALLVVAVAPSCCTVVAGEAAFGGGGGGIRFSCIGVATPNDPLSSVTTDGGGRGRKSIGVKRMACGALEPMAGTLAVAG